MGNGNVKSEAGRQGTGGIQRLGIMGGTFDPVHLGHLAIAEAVREELSLQRVLFIPAGMPPHKDPVHITPSRHRMAMVRAALEGSCYFLLSDIEVKREGGPTYTVDTLHEITDEYGSGCRVFFITGADMLLDLLNWRQFEEVFRLCSFAVVPRPGYDYLRILKQADFLKQNYSADIHVVSGPALDISSTDIRERVRQGKSVRYLVPEAVREYILRNGLYREETPAEANLQTGVLQGEESGSENLKRESPVSEKTIEEWKRKLRETLTEERYFHSLGTMETAVKLAERYCADREKALIAGLLHDCGKVAKGPKMLELCIQHGAEIDGITRREPRLLHASLGKVFVQTVYGVKDMEVIEAIGSHTTGKENMTLLEKIVFIADYIEPGRDFPGVEEVRNMVWQELDKALIMAFDNIIKRVMGKGGLLHPRTIEARNCLIAAMDR